MIQILVVDQFKKKLFDIKSDYKSSIFIITNIKISYAKRSTRRD